MSSIAEWERGKNQWTWDRKIKANQSERNTTEKKNKHALTDLQDNNKRSICITGKSEANKKEGGAEKVFEEIIAEKYSKQNKRHKPVESRSWVHIKQDNQKKYTPRHIIVKLMKTYETKGKKILKAVRNKWHLTYRGETIWMTANFSSEIMETRRMWYNIFKC